MQNALVNLLIGVSNMLYSVAKHRTAIDARNASSAASFAHIREEYEDSDINPYVGVAADICLTILMILPAAIAVAAYLCLRRGRDDLLKSQKEWRGMDGTELN